MTNESTRRLGEFLRARREALRAESLGLATAGRRRRVQGLRREEVAQRASISTDYYTRLEQGRVPPPSPAVLSALVDALLLGPEEELYLRDLAHRHPDVPMPPNCAQVPARQLRLLEDLTTLPGLVMSPFMHVLAWNQQAARLFLDFGCLPPGERNLARLIYLNPELRPRFVDWTEIARACTAIMRTGAARAPHAPEIEQVVAGLARMDETFAACWRAQDISRRPRSRSVYRHPQAGEMVLDWQLLTSAESPDHLIAIISPGDSLASSAAFKALAGT